MNQTFFRICRVEETKHILDVSSILYSEDKRCLAETVKEFHLERQWSCFDFKLVLNLWSPHKGCLLLDIYSNLPMILLY